MVNNIGIDDPQPCNYSPEWDGEIPELPPPPEPPLFQSPPPKFSLLHSLSPHISLPPKAQNTYFSFRIKKLFDILKVGPCSLERKVKLAFMILARKYHSDKQNINVSELSFETSVEKFKSLSTSNFFY